MNDAAQLILAFFGGIALLCIGCGTFAFLANSSLEIEWKRQPKNTRKDRIEP
jgi:hypothetical protein